MARETIDRREKLLKLREELLAAEEDFLQGRFYTVDEVAEKCVKLSSRQPLLPQRINNFTKE